MRLSFFFLKLLSYLPKWLLYGASDIMAWGLNVWGYRKKVIINNLTNSFPEKEKKERVKIMKKFYRHLSDLLIESIISLRLSEKEVLERYKCVNPEVAEKFFIQNKSVILISGHYNNWEYMVLSLTLQFPFHGVGVGKRLSDKKMDVWLNNYRQRYGTEVVFASNVRDKFKTYEQEKKLTAYMMLIDQSPRKKNRALWMNFLNQDTGVIYGAENFARKYDYPALFYIVRKVKRGYYEFELKEITANSATAEFGEITTTAMRMLEREINERPEFWLWSHKRWKHKRPEGM